MTPIEQAIEALEDMIGQIEQGHMATGMNKSPSVQAAVDRGVAALSALRSMPAEPVKRCPYCDDTGDVHSIDGEWRGTCKCPAGQPQQAEGCDEYFKARPQLESAVNRGIFEAGYKAAQAGADRDVEAQARKIELAAERYARDFSVYCDTQSLTDFRVCRVSLATLEAAIRSGLLATPPTAPVLTEAEIDAIFNEHHDPQETPWANWRRFARAIERRVLAGDTGAE